MAFHSLQIFQDFNERVGGECEGPPMDYTEKEILIAEQLKEAGVQWRARQGDHYADANLMVHFVTKEEADELVHDPEPTRDRIWLPSWHQCREILDRMGFLLRDHSEDVTKSVDGDSQRYVGVAVESRHRGRFAGEGSTDLEAIYEVIYKVITTTAKERKGTTRSGRLQGKICSFCAGVMRLNEVGGNWEYVCENCGPTRT